MWCRRWNLLVVPALAGCASIVPPELVGQVDRQVTGADLLREPLRYVGRTILVGGEFLLVHNIPEQTELEILERPLRYEEPMVTDRSAGRFLIRQPGFLDPAVYAVGRRVTVVGTVTGVERRKIGEVEYQYPVLESRRLKLWPLQTAYYPYPPSWYDPFWGPCWYGEPFCDPYWLGRRPLLR